METTKLPEWGILLPGSEEWDVAWARLNEVYGDTVCQDPGTGEVWQYMSSSLRPEEAREASRSPEALYLHEFRHRWLPLEFWPVSERGNRLRERNQRKYIRFYSSPGWTPPSIEEVRRSLEEEGR
jgi:hypothetical protein